MKQSKLCPTCGETMKQGEKRYSKKKGIYYCTGYYCEHCGVSCTVDEDLVCEYYDKNGQKMYGGK